jgi:hypothetical protein
VGIVTEAIERAPSGARTLRPRGGGAPDPHGRGLRPAVHHVDADCDRAQGQCRGRFEQDCDAGGDQPYRSHQSDPNRHIISGEQQPPGRAFRQAGLRRDRGDHGSGGGRDERLAAQAAEKRPPDGGRDGAATRGRRVSHHNAADHVHRDDHESAERDAGAEPANRRAPVR